MTAKRAAPAPATRRGLGLRQIVAALVVVAILAWHGCTIESAYLAAAAIPGATLSLYDDGGHFFYLAHTERFNAEIEAFMARHD